MKTFREFLEESINTHNPLKDTFRQGRKDMFAKFNKPLGDNVLSPAERRSVKAARIGSGKKTAYDAGQDDVLYHKDDPLEKSHQELKRAMAPNDGAAHHIHPEVVGRKTRSIYIKKTRFSPKKVRPLPEEALNEGATDYIHHVPSDKESDVAKHWEETKKRDRSYNGHQEGYSGDSQTFGNKIDFHRHITHKDRKSAEDYILDKHQKWNGPIAVKYKHEGKTHHAIGGWAAE
jgi:hypothetical protein